MSRESRTHLFAAAVLVGLLIVASCGNDGGEQVVVEGEVVVRYFDIADLCPPIPGHVINGRVVPVPDSPDPGRYVSQETVLSFVRDAMGGDPAWKEPASIQVRMSILIVRNTCAIHGRIEVLLDDIRAAGGLPEYLC